MIFSIRYVKKIFLCIVRESLADVYLLDRHKLPTIIYEYDDEIDLNSERLYLRWTRERFNK